MADIKTFFEAAAVNRASNGLLTDGSVVWEIITPEGERVATTSRRKATWSWKWRSTWR